MGRVSSNHFRFDELPVELQSMIFKFAVEPENDASGVRPTINLIQFWDYILGRAGRTIHPLLGSLNSLGPWSTDVY